MNLALEPVQSTPIHWILFLTKLQKFNFNYRCWPEFSTFMMCCPIFNLLIIHFYYSILISKRTCVALQISQFLNFSNFLRFQLFQSQGSKNHVKTIASWFSSGLYFNSNNKKNYKRKFYLFTISNYTWSISKLSISTNIKYIPSLLKSWWIPFINRLQVFWTSLRYVQV